MIDLTVPSRPTRETTLLEIAYTMSLRSTCSRAHVGAVIAKDGRILSTGYNGAPAGLPHCDHFCDCSLAGFDGHHNDDCNYMRGCTTAVHAETNAIAFAARHGVGLEGAEMFTTHMPCVPCAQLIINAGLIRVFYNQP